MKLPASSAFSLPTMGYAWRVELTGKQSRNIPTGWSYCAIDRSSWRAVIGIGQKSDAGQWNCPVGESEMLKILLMQGKLDLSRAARARDLRHHNGRRARRYAAASERARAFKSVSPGMLPPLGIVFGLFVGFTAAQVWSDSATASAAVDREASALRSVALLAAAFPGEPKNRLDTLISSYIAEAIAQEWPLMAHRAITLTRAQHALSEALQFTLSLQPAGAGQQIAQREIISALQNAMDA